MVPRTYITATLDDGFEVINPYVFLGECEYYEDCEGWTTGAEKAEAFIADIIEKRGYLDLTNWESLEDFFNKAA